MTMQAVAPISFSLPSQRPGRCSCGAMIETTDEQGALCSSGHRALRTDGALLWEAAAGPSRPIPDSRSLKGREIGNGPAGAESALAAIVRVWERGEPPARANVVAGLMAELTSVILYADGGIGKSYLAVLLLILALIGRPFCGRYVKKIQSALFVDAELDDDEFTRRAFAVARGLGLSAPPPGLHYWKLPGPLSDRGTQDAARVVLAATEAEFTVLDSLTLASGVDATDQAAMTNVIRETDSWPGTKLLIDHPPAPKPGINTSSYRPFGTTFKFNLARSVVQLVRAEGGALALRQTKNNFGPLAEPIHLAMSFEGGAVRFDHIADNDERLAGIEEHLPAIERVARELAEHGTQGATPEQMAEPLDMRPKTVRNHLTALKQKGRAESGGGKWFSRLPAPLVSRESGMGEEQREWAA